jgi:hypothetical protein
MEHSSQPAKHQDTNQELGQSQQERSAEPLDVKEARRQLGWDLMEAQRQWRGR